jgi:DNA-binding transcriptional MerR regulator
MKQYFKINEIAKLYGIGTDSLRYYEKIGLLEPKRDSNNSYRLYDLKDLWRINVIRDLRELGFSTDRIGQYLQNRTTQTTEELLTEERKLLIHELDRLTTLKNNVEQRLQTIKEAQQQKIGVVECCNIEDRNCFIIDQGYTLDEEMDILIRRLLNVAKEISIIGNNRIGSMISLDHAINGDYCYDGVFMINKNGPSSFPGGDYLTITHKGGSLENSICIPRLLQYVQAHNLTPKGPVLELLWVDIHAAADRKEHLTELQLAVDP